MNARTALPRTAPGDAGAHPSPVARPRPASRVGRPEEPHPMRKIVASSLLVSLLVASVAVAAPAAKKPAEQRVAIEVTSKGFVPDTVRASVGRPLVLSVTRRVERTCAKEIVIKAAGINQPLPLDQTVEVHLTPKKKGPMRFACGMDMIAGVILVR
jgi:plastocyanin domain-containing protein